MLEEGTILKKPFRLILPHFLTGLSKEELCRHEVGIAKSAHSSFKGESGEISYRFNPCDSALHFASCGDKSYAVLESDHCCFLCVQEKHKPELVRDAGYCLTRVERLISPTRNEVQFIATYFMKTCIKVQYGALTTVADLINMPL